MKTKTKPKIYDTIIIGAGIAGCTAAIYAARKRMNFLLLSAEFGGQFLVSNKVFNYPGIIQITGADFAELMQRQLDFNGVKVKEVEVKSVQKVKDHFVVQTEKETYQTKTVILATGSHARKLNVPGEEKLVHRGLTYCSICDGPLFKNQEVAIIGSGNSALEAVDFMKDLAKKIYLLVLEDKLSAHEYLIENTKKIKNLQLIYHAQTKEILGDKFVTGLRYEQKGISKELKVKGIIVEIGRVPSTELVQDLVKLDEHRHVEIDCQTNTSVPGIFAVGDCSSVHEYQYIISAGQGCIALLKVARYLANKKS